MYVTFVGYSWNIQGSIPISWKYSMSILQTYICPVENFKNNVTKCCKLFTKSDKLVTKYHEKQHTSEKKSYTCKKRDEK